MTEAMMSRYEQFVQEACDAFEDRGFDLKAPAIRGLTYALLALAEAVRPHRQNAEDHQPEPAIPFIRSRRRRQSWVT